MNSGKGKQGHARPRPRHIVSASAMCGLFATAWRHFAKLRPFFWAPMHGTIHVAWFIVWPKPAVALMVVLAPAQLILSCHRVSRRRQRQRVRGKGKGKEEGFKDSNSENGL